MPPIPLVMFAGGEHRMPALLEDMCRVRRACARDVLERAIESHSYDPIILVTDDAAWATSLSDLHISVCNAYCTWVQQLAHC